MSPEAAAFLEKSRKLLAEADTMLTVGLNEQAGRTAYLAAFHAAQALIFERRHRVLKTHHGVQSEFLHLTRDDRRIDPEMRVFLRQAYNLKSIADYETGPEASVSGPRAAKAVADGKRFLAQIAAHLDDGTESPAPA